ncbi:MAG: glycoside hydrolase family 13 protein [Clostridia bacterium]
MIIHDSQNQYYRNPPGAVPDGTEVMLRLSVAEETLPVKCVCRIWNGREQTFVPMEYDWDDLSYVCFIRALGVLHPLWYYFILEYEQGRTLFYGNNAESMGGRGLIYSTPPPSFQITVFSDDLVVPGWFCEGSVYHIFVDRFSESDSYENPARDFSAYYHSKWSGIPLFLPRNNRKTYFPDDFFGGNLQGIIERLGYIDSLGVRTIYLSPLFKSRSNHKYDTGDYDRIDPGFGTNGIFTELCDKAADLGIRVILDGVFSHTGDDSIYFNRFGNYKSIGAHQSKESPYFDWFTFEEYPDKYECWWDIETMPTVDKDNPDFQNFIYGEDGVAARWLDRGASGWRLDVADELPMSFLRGLRRRLKSKDPDALIMGEVWEDASNKVAYGELRNYCSGDTLDSVMNYPAREAILGFMMHGMPSSRACAILRSQIENYPRPFLHSVMNMLGSHDRLRVRTFMSGAPDPASMTREQQAYYEPSESEYNLSIPRVKCAAAMTFTIPGVPCIYYGDEAGMTGMADPFNRGVYPWGSEDAELMEFFRLVSNFRRDNPVLMNGDAEYFAFADDAMGCLRKSGRHFVFTVINRNPFESISVSLGLPGSSYEMRSISGPLPAADKETGLFSLSIPPLGHAIICNLP